MNINAERFFALTAMLAAPLVTASACVITDNDPDNDNTGGTGSATMTTDASATMTATTDTDATSDTMSTSVSATDTDATTDTDPTGDTTSDPDTTGGTTGGNELGNCCVPDGSLGCEVEDVSACVCELDPYCCETAWDENCAQEVNSLGCGECDFPPQPFDCTCVNDCDGTPVDSQWQVCGSDFESAATAGQAACEEELGANCKVFSCDECSCFTAEVAEIECK